MSAGGGLIQFLSKDGTKTKLFMKTNKDKVVVQAQLTFTLLDHGEGGKEAKSALPDKK